MLQSRQSRIGLALMTAGAALLLWAGADKGLAMYRQARLQREAARLFTPAATPAPAATGEALHRLGEHMSTPAPAPGAETDKAAAPKPSLVPPGAPLSADAGPLVGRDGLKAETPLFRLLIPAIDVQNVVVEGSTDPALKLGPGHLEGTALPGESGNTVIVGHRDYFFWALGDLKVGDPIYVQARRGYILYKVSELRVVKDTDFWVTEPTRQQTLTLITCYPLIHPGYTDQRLVVFARRAGPDA